MARPASSRAGSTPTAIWWRHDITTGLVRDFAFAASPRYHEIQREVGPVLVRTLAFDDRGGEVVADTTVEALRFYGQTYGDYPYRVFTAAETTFPGGMEYPTVVLLGSSLYQPSSIERGLLTSLVAHETAHQWWYGLVGDDQIQEPWLDEGMAQFSMYWFLQNHGTNSKPSHNASYDDAGLLHRSVPSYGADSAAYNYQIYEHGPCVMFHLRSAVGPDVFDAILRTYFSRWRSRDCACR